MNNTKFIWFCFKRLSVQNSGIYEDIFCLCVFFDIKAFLIYHVYLKFEEKHIKSAIFNFSNILHIKGQGIILRSAGEIIFVASNSIYEHSHSAVMLPNVSHKNSHLQLKSSLIPVKSRLRIEPRQVAG